MIATTSIDGLAVHYEADEQDAAEIVREACEKSDRLIRQHWELDTPKDCRIYVMTSWRQFVFHSAPWPWKVLLGMLYPLWSFRVKRLWAYAGGWVQRYGKRVAVGIKPPRLLLQAERGIGDRIFVRDTDVRKELEHITCHELTHAFSTHLRLPMWLHEGLAQVTVDRYAGQQMVRQETLQALADPARETRPAQYRGLRAGDADRLVYHYVRGYWVTRYIEDVKPDLLREMLSLRHRQKALESLLAQAFGISRETFWTNIDSEVVAYYGG